MPGRRPSNQTGRRGIVYNQGILAGNPLRPRDACRCDHSWPKRRDGTKRGRAARPPPCTSTMTPHHTGSTSAPALRRRWRGSSTTCAGAERTHLRRARIAKCEPRFAELGARGQVRRAGQAAALPAARRARPWCLNISERRLPGSCFRPHKFLHQKKTITDFCRKFEAGQEVRRGGGGP